MDGWRIRRGIAGDVPIFAAGLIVFGGVIATIVHVVIDVGLHRHATRRTRA